MYVKVTDPTIAVFDPEGKFLAWGSFQLPPVSEAALLSLVNDGKTPDMLILLKVVNLRSSKDYRPPNLNITVKRKGILRAVFLTATNDASLIDIRLTYNAVARGGKTDGGYSFDSVQLSNIQVDSVNAVTF